MKRRIWTGWGEVGEGVEEAVVVDMEVVMVEAMGRAMVTGVKEAMVEDMEVKEVMLEAMAMVVGMLATVVAMEVNRQEAMEAATVATLRVVLEVGILSSKGATVATATVVDP